jgi:hypothetical protein
LQPEKVKWVRPNFHSAKSVTVIATYNVDWLAAVAKHGTSCCALHFLWHGFSFLQELVVRLLQEQAEDEWFSHEAEFWKSQGASITPEDLKYAMALVGCCMPFVFTRNTWNPCWLRRVHAWSGWACVSPQHLHAKLCLTRA